MENNELFNPPVSEPSLFETIKKEEDDVGLYIKVLEPCESQTLIKTENDLNDQKIKENLNKIECSESLYLEVDAVQESVENPEEVYKVEQDVETLEERIINTFDAEHRSGCESQASVLANESLHVKEEDDSEWGVLIQNVTTLGEKKYDLLPENSSKHDMTEIHSNVSKPFTPQILISKEQLAKQNAFLVRQLQKERGGNEILLNEQKNITKDQFAERNSFLAQQLLKEKGENDIVRNEQNITIDQLVNKNTVLSQQLEEIEDKYRILKYELMVTKRKTKPKEQCIVGVINQELKKNKEIVFQQSREIKNATQMFKIRNQELNLKTIENAKLQQELLALELIIQQNKITADLKNQQMITQKEFNECKTELEILRNENKRLEIGKQYQEQELDKIKGTFQLKNKETEEIMKLKHQELKMTLDANLKLQQRLSNVQQMLAENHAKQETHENVLKCNINELINEVEKAKGTIKLKNQQLEKITEMMRQKNQELALTFDANVKLQQELCLKQTLASKNTELVYQNEQHVKRINFLQKQVAKCKINKFSERNHIVSESEHEHLVDYDCTVELEETKQKIKQTNKEREKANGTTKLKNQQLERVTEMPKLKNQKMTLAIKNQELKKIRGTFEGKNRELDCCKMKDKGRSEFVFSTQKVESIREQENNFVKDSDKSTQGLSIESLLTNDSLPIKDEIMADDLGIIVQNVSSDKLNKIPAQQVQLFTKDGMSISDRNLSKNDSSTTKSDVLTGTKRTISDGTNQLPDDICFELKSECSLFDGSTTQQTQVVKSEPELKRIKTELPDM